MEQQHPIYVYTDAQALADGVLVSVAGLPITTIHGYRVNRVTRAVWETYTQLMGRSRLTRPVVDVTGLIDTLNAVIDKGTTGPGDTLVGTAPDGRTLWCEPNEVGGYTAMFPEDR